MIFVKDLFKVNECRDFVNEREEVSYFLYSAMFVNWLKSMEVVNVFMKRSGSEERRIDSYSRTGTSTSNRQKIQLSGGRAASVTLWYRFQTNPHQTSPGKKIKI